MASILIKRSSGCRLLQCHFAVPPPTVALAKVLSTWGPRLTWASQREHAAQIIKAVESHKYVEAFISSATRHRTALPGLGDNQLGYADSSLDDNMVGGLDAAETDGFIGQGLAG